MAVPDNIIEMVRSRGIHESGRGEERTKILQVNGTTEQAMRDGGVPALGDTWDDRPDLIVVDVTAVFKTRNDDADYTEVTVKYSTEQTLLTNPGDMTVDYDFAGGSDNVKFGARVLHNPDGSRTYVDPVVDGKQPKRSVGQFGDSGVSAIRPKFMMRITKLFDKAMLDKASNHLYSLVGTVNKQLWNGFGPWEVLYMGGDVPQVGVDRWQGAFHFMGDEAYHDYGWYKINTKTKTVEEPILFSEVYLDGDFSLLEMELPVATT